MRPLATRHRLVHPVPSNASTDSTSVAGSLIAKRARRCAPSERPIRPAILHMPVPPLPPSAREWAGDLLVADIQYQQLSIIIDCEIRDPKEGIIGAAKGRADFPHEMEVLPGCDSGTQNEQEGYGSNAIDGSITLSNLRPLLHSGAFSLPPPSSVRAEPPSTAYGCRITCVGSGCVPRRSG